MKPTSQLSEAHIKKILDGLDRLQKGRDPEDVLLDNFDLQERFRITRRTSYNWRRKKLLPFLLIERKVFYRLSDVRHFLNQHQKWYEPP